MNVLIVEDERDVAELIGRCLDGMGLETRVAHDAAAADALLELDREVDAVTLDLSMPGRNGVEWLEEIAARAPELARRTLVITGADLERSLVERVARCGAGVLAKPFDIADLETAVRAQLARPVHGGAGRN